MDLLYILIMLLPISILCFAIYVLTKYIIATLETKFHEYKTEKNTKQNEKKDWPLFKKDILRIYSQFYNEPKWIIYTILLMIPLIFMIMRNLSFIGQNLIDIINTVVFFAVIGAFSIFALQLAKDKSAVSKLQSIVVLIGYIVLFATIPIMIFSQGMVTQETMVIAFLLFFGVIFYSVIVAIKYYHKKVAVLFIVAAYALVLFIGSVSFGEFYLIKYADMFQGQIAQINNTLDKWNIILVIAKTFIGGFFEFPSEELLCTVSIFQFFIGKFLDIVLLGYVAAQFINVGDKDVKRNIFK